MRIVTKVARDEIKQTRLLPDMAIGRNTIVFVYAGGGKQSTKRVSGLELICFVLDDSRKRYASGARNVPAARHLAGIFTRIKFGGARVNDRHTRLLQICAN